MPDDVPEIVKCLQMGLLLVMCPFALVGVVLISPVLLAALLLGWAARRAGLRQNWWVG